MTGPHLSISWGTIIGAAAVIGPSTALSYFIGRLVQTQTLHSDRLRSMERNMEKLFTEHRRDMAQLGAALRETQSILEKEIQILRRDGCGHEGCPAAGSHNGRKLSRNPGT